MMTGANMEPMQVLTRTGAVSRRTVRLRPRAFPPPLGPRLRAALAEAHANDPFRPSGPREAARRVADVADGLGLEAIVFRGGLDVGGAELDHVWVVAADRVLDAAFPLLSEHFVSAVRAYVAGDIDTDALERAAHPYSLRWRVVGSFPDRCRYVGSPVWGSTH